MFCWSFVNISQTFLGRRKTLNFLRTSYAHDVEGRKLNLPVNHCDCKSGKKTYKWRLLIPFVSVRGSLKGDLSPIPFCVVSVHSRLPLPPGWSALPSYNLIVILLRQTPTHRLAWQSNLLVYLMRFLETFMRSMRQK